MTPFKDDIVGDIVHTYLSVKFELKKYLKTRRFLFAVSLAIFMPIIVYFIPLISNTEFPDLAIMFAATNLGLTSLLIIISGAIFAGDAICGEFEKKTALLLFPTPQRRTSIFVGKYIAALIAIFSIVSLYYLITMLEIAQIYGIGEISTDFAKSFLLALLYAVSAMSIIYFFSSILKRTITSSLLGFFLLMMILPMISMVLTRVEIDPWFLVTHSSDLITDVLVVASTAPVDPGSRFATTGFAPDFYVGIGVMVAYTIIFFLTSIVIANRKKME